MKNKKIILIPGWMNGGGMYHKKNSLYDFLGIWEERILPNKKIETEFIIGHSLGCNWALLNWKENRNTKLILVNPLLPKRKKKDWFSRWRNFCKNEARPEGKEVVWSLRTSWFGLRQCWKLLSIDFDHILTDISKENIFIIHGERDIFYCDEEFREHVRSKNIKTIEVRGAGHDWHEKFDREIEKIIAR